MTRGRERAALLALLALGAALRLARPGADLPLAYEATDAPIQDALWYLEAGTWEAEGLPRDLELVPPYDPPVWVQVGRVWFGLTGVSLASAQALGAVVSLLTALLAWRVARAALGPAGGLTAAAVLCTLPPFVWLSRTTLVYGPAALALTAAAALALAAGRRPRQGAWGLEAAAWAALGLSAWASLEVAGAGPGARGALAAVGAGGLVGWWRLRRTRPEQAWRGALLLAAWAIAVTTTLVLRPPAAALAGGLALLHVARARGRLQALVAPLLAASVGLVLLLAWDPGALRAHTLDRLQRYVAAPGLDAAALAARALRLGAAPALDGTGSGFLPLAPGAGLVACLGAAVALGRLRARGRSGDLAALALGWALLFGVGAVLSSYRPLRYFAVVAPPLALLAAFAVARLAAGRSPQVSALAAAAVAALAAPHALDLLAGPLRLPDLLLAAGAGAAVTAALVRARLALPARSPRALALGALVVATGPGAAACALDLARPTWSTAQANRAAAAALGAGASLVGPHASVLALGHGITRRRAPWIDAAPERIDATIERLRLVGATHIALGIEQARSSRLLHALAERGVPTTLVGIFLPRGTPVLLVRLPWATDGGAYSLSAFERRRLGDADPGAPLTAEEEDDLLLPRVRALALEGLTERADAVATASASDNTELMHAARRAIAAGGQR